MKLGRGQAEQSLGCNSLDVRSLQQTMIVIGLAPRSKKQKQYGLEWNFGTRLRVPRHCEIMSGGFIVEICSEHAMLSHKRPPDIVSPLNI